MTNSRQGTNLKLTPARKMVLEMMHHARKVPSIPLSQVMDLEQVAQARQKRGNLSWLAIFMRAYGIVCQRRPVLRRAFIPLPYPRLYEHPCSEAAFLVERQWQGEHVVLGAKIRSPERLSLLQLHQLIRGFQETPVEKVGYFRQILRMGRMPALVRRFAFWQAFYFSGFKRAKHFGTFMISSLGNFGVEQEHSLTPLATYLSIGPIEAGKAVVRIIYDHRVTDGRTVARCLNDLEDVLNTTMVQELNETSRRNYQVVEVPA